MGLPGFIYSKAKPKVLSLAISANHAGGLDNYGRMVFMTFSWILSPSRQFIFIIKCRMMAIIALVEQRMDKSV